MSSSVLFNNLSLSGGLGFPLLSGLRLNGSISTSGDVCNLGLLHATYEGYVVVNGTKAYVFDVSILGLKIEFAVTLSGICFVPPSKPISGPCDPCFLRGTRIATPDGEVAVEALQVGDLVATRVDGATVFRPLSWIGHRSVSVAPGSAVIEEYPVRIRAGAVRDGVPIRDLLVTSEHCLFIDDLLIPARMLVNGRSILVETGMSSYEYFHLELERHAILVADGMETESYLDTGNRGLFANADSVALRPEFEIDAGHAGWATHAAAPLCTDRARVEPIWVRLETRAALLGLAAPARPALSNQPNLRLLTDTGLEIAPTLCDGSVHAFVLPAGVRGVRLRSQSSRPCDMVGPFVDDRRPLGVLVGRIGLSAGRRRIACHAHLSTERLSGWYGIEGDTCRWTNGDAELPIDLSVADGRPVFLDIELVQAGPYLDQALLAA